MAAAAVGIAIVIGVSLVYYNGEKALVPESSEGTGPYVSSSSTQTASSPGVITSRLNCTGELGQFVETGALYTTLGYPKLTGYDIDNFVNPISPSFIYFVQFPNMIGDVALGNVEVPVITVCQALENVVTRLGISPANYTLAEISLDDAELNIAAGNYPTASWTFYFARIYQGYWLAGSDDGFSAVGSVNPVTGLVSGASVENATLSPLAQNLTLAVNSTRALQIIRSTPTTGVPSPVSNGTVTSIDLRISKEISSNEASLGLVWIISTSTPGFVGYFEEDAATGQLLQARSDPTSYCSGDVCASNEPEPGVYSNPLYPEARGLDVRPETFEVNGTGLGLPNGTYAVYVPEVIVMTPGSSGSIVLNFTGVGENCSDLEPGMVCSSCSGQPCFSVTPSVNSSSLPSGVSFQFSEATFRITASENVSDRMTIAVAANATEGTYIVPINSPPDTIRSGYIILSIWNGQGQWPVLPLLSVPMADGQPQPIISTVASP